MTTKSDAFNSAFSFMTEFSAILSLKTGPYKLTYANNNLTIRYMGATAPLLYSPDDGYPYIMDAESWNQVSPSDVWGLVLEFIDGTGANLPFILPVKSPGISHELLTAWYFLDRSASGIPTSLAADIHSRHWHKLEMFLSHLMHGGSASAFTYDDISYIIGSMALTLDNIDTSGDVAAKVEALNVAANQSSFDVF